MRPFGYRPDPHGYRRTSAKRLLGKMRGTAIKPRTVPIMDQRDTGSCVGHAIAGSLYASGAAFIPSPKGIYGVARAIDRLPMADGTLEPLTDDGAEPNQAFRGVEEWGIRRLIWLPGDCSSDSINDEPSLFELEVCDETKLAGCYAVDTEDMRAVLDLGIAVCVAWCVNDADMLAGPETVLDAHPGEANHYSFIINWREKDGEIQYLLQNSWNTSWGDNGRAWVTSRFVDKATDKIATPIKKAT